jgi:chromosome segregation ATPase
MKKEFDNRLNDLLEQRQRDSESLKSARTALEAANQDAKGARAALVANQKEFYSLKSRYDDLKVRSDELTKELDRCRKSYTPKR